MAGPATPLGVLAAGTGFVLVYSAVLGRNPLTELRRTLTTGRLAGGERRPLDYDPPPAGIARIGTPLTSPAISQIGTPLSETGGTIGAPQLVEIGQGSHRLAPVAAAGFADAQARYGRRIPITDSARDYQAQADAYAADPTRFGNPAGNAHVLGLAVDVNLPALGLNPQGVDPADWLNDAGYRRLHEAMTAAGWCNWQISRGDTGGKIPEPWHYSYGGCR